MNRWYNVVILLLATAVGVAAFLSPFFATTAQTAPAALAHAEDSPFLLLAIVGICLVAVVSSLMAGAMSARTVALLGILSAVTGVLRAVPGPAGFSAVFFLMVLCGYAYGPSFGFLLGALSIMLSALLGAGVGPWLPFQMFTAGWLGLSSGWLPRLKAYPRLELVMLAAWGLLWGLLYGAIMNLWFWPYVTGGAAAEGRYWEAGLGLWVALKRYGAFYLLTSLWWDAWRAVGNAALVLLLGRPLLKVLRRFERLLRFEHIQTAQVEQPFPPRTSPGPAQAAQSGSTTTAVP